jgi:signal peptidase II
MTWLDPIFVVAAVLIADQATKALVMSRTTSHKSVLERPFVCIRYVVNRRGVLASFGGKPILLTIWALSIAIAALALYSEMVAFDMFGSIGIGAAVGGATGNLLDQLRRGAVVDFIIIGPWPPFNLADAAIILGGGLVLLSMC